MSFWTVWNCFQRLHISVRAEESVFQPSVPWVNLIKMKASYFIKLFWQAWCKISDNGLEWLLRFMFKFFHAIGITCNSEYLCQMSLIFPSSLYLLRKFVRIKRDNFVKFAVCPKCSSIYDLDNCTREVGGRIVLNICTNKPFKKGRRGERGEALARKVVLNSGKVCFYPNKLYCFNSVIGQLEGVLKRPGVPEMCEQWRDRQVPECLRWQNLERLSHLQRKQLPECPHKLSICNKCWLVSTF